MNKRQVIDGKQECIGCQQWLPLDHFHKHKPSSTGRAWRCKECHKKTLLGGLTPSQRSQKWASEHPEHFKRIAKASRDRIIHDPKRLKARRAHVMDYYYRSKATVVASHRKWRFNNPWAMVADSLRAKVRYTVNSFTKGSKTFKSLTGLDGNQFRAHLESKWLPGMSWANFGRDGWTIGHIKSVASFKDVLLTVEGQQACFHYSNLQPEWQHANGSKHTKETLTPAQISLLKTGSHELPPSATIG